MGKWSVYLHDRREIPIPDTYALGDPVFVLLTKAVNESVFARENHKRGSITVRFWTDQYSVKLIVEK